MKAEVVLLLLLGAVPSLAQSQQLCDTAKSPLSSPTSRFKDHGDGTVTDTVSKLMWLRCAAGQTWSNGTCSGSAAPQDWQSAQQVARKLNQGGQLFFNDWRLPQIRELATITERQCENPRINLTVFPATPPGAFWTMTPRPGTTAEDAVFVLGFGSDGVKLEDKSAANFVRLVRTDL